MTRPCRRDRAAPALALRRDRAPLARRPRRLAQRRPALPGDRRRRHAPGPGSARHLARAGRAHIIAVRRRPRLGHPARGRPRARRCASPAPLGITSLVAWGRQRGLGGEGGCAQGRALRRRRRALARAPDLLAFGRDEEYLERALGADDEALAAPRPAPFLDRGGGVGPRPSFCNGAARRRVAARRASPPSMPTASPATCWPCCHSSASAPSRS